MARVIIYPRVSTWKQKDGESLEAQEEYCRAYAARVGYDVVAVIVEQYTGHDSLEERIELKRARDMIQRGEADGLLVWKLDRSNRDMADGFILLREINRAGGFLESTLEGRVTTDTAGKMMYAFRLAQAEGEWEDIRVRTQPAIRRRAEKGKPLTGSCPLWGYRYVGKKRDAMEIDEDVARYVRRLFQLVNQGVTLRQIAMRFTQEGVPTATQVLAQRGELGEKRTVTTLWRWQTLNKLVRNSTYCGKRIAYGGKRVRKTTKKTGKPYYDAVRRDLDDPACIVQAVPAIVSEETWLAAQAQLKRNQEQSARRNKNPESALLRAGIAVCGHCGGRLVVANQTKGTYYVCSNRACRTFDLNGKTCPGGSYSVAATPVDRDVWAMAQAILEDTPRLRRLVQSRQDKNQAALAALQAQAGDVQDEIAEHEGKLALLKRRLATEEDDTVYAILKEEIKREDGTLVGLRKRHGNVSFQAGIVDSLVNNLETTLQYYMQAWDGPKTVAVKS